MGAIHPEGMAPFEEEPSNVVGLFYVSDDVFVTVSSHSKPALDAQEMHQSLAYALDVHAEIARMR